MYKVLCSSIMAVVLMSQCGCGPSADTLARQQIDQLNELADAMESDAKKAELEAINKRMEETNKAIKDMDLSDAEKERLTEAFGTEMTKATARVAKAGMAQMQEQMKELMPNMPNMPAMPMEMPNLP
jgi:hypothetical protein